MCTIVFVCRSTEINAILSSTGGRKCCIDLWHSTFHSPCGTFHLHLLANALDHPPYSARLHRAYPMNSTEWVWDPSLGVYFHAPSNTYAINSNGEWTYVLATDFKPGQPSTVRAPQELEDGEVEDDVGWGALMEESPKPKPENAAGDESAQVLRLVVLESDVLDPGKIAMIDSRPEGVQLGRDKQPGQLRVRLKEMAVSKTHAVVYRGEEWCIVDLGEPRLCL